MIEVTGLHKAFGEVVAVDDVSFKASDGRITGLLGPNGAGKTTTLRMLYTLLKPDRGEAHIDDIDVLAHPHLAQKKIGVLPDTSGLYPRLTSREHIQYYGRLHGITGAELERRVNDLMWRMEMGDIADRRTHGFSHGQRMKVAIGRALVHGPRNILLDEPTNGLDVMSTRTIRDIIRRLRDEGKCVLFSSHVMQEVSALCDKIVVIARGTVVASGSPDELRQRTGKESLEDAFVDIIGSEEGLEA